MVLVDQLFAKPKVARQFFEEDNNLSVGIAILLSQARQIAAYKLIDDKLIAAMSFAHISDSVCLQDCDEEV